MAPPTTNMVFTVYDRQVDRDYVEQQGYEYDPVTRLGKPRNAPGEILMDVDDHVRVDGRGSIMAGGSTKTAIGRLVDNQSFLLDVSVNPGQNKEVLVRLTVPEMGLVHETRFKGKGHICYATPWMGTSIDPATDRLVFYDPRVVVIPDTFEAQGIPCTFEVEFFAIDRLLKFGCSVLTYQRTDDGYTMTRTDGTTKEAIGQGFVVLNNLPQT